MSEASVPDYSGSIFDKLVALAGDEARNVDADDPVDDWCRLGLHHAYRRRALKWTGPVAFARAYGAVPGIEHDFGTCWGSNGDQRVSIRVEVGCDSGQTYIPETPTDIRTPSGVERARQRLLNASERSNVAQAPTRAAMPAAGSLRRPPARGRRPKKQLTVRTRGSPAAHLHVVSVSSVLSSVAGEQDVDQLVSRKYCGHPAFANVGLQYGHQRSHTGVVA
jgi:hypothetical protein